MRGQTLISSTLPSFPWFHEFFQHCLLLPWSQRVLRTCSVLTTPSRLNYYAGLRLNDGLRSVLRSSSSSSLLSLMATYRHSSVLSPSSKQQQSPSGLLFWLGINTRAKKAGEKWRHFLKGIPQPPHTAAPFYCSPASHTLPPQSVSVDTVLQSVMIRNLNPEVKGRD